MQPRHGVDVGRAHVRSAHEEHRGRGIVGERGGGGAGCCFGDYCGYFGGRDCVVFGDYQSDGGGQLGRASHGGLWDSSGSGDSTCLQGYE